mmetsp:Transcript_38509/g.71139  ORF Transcript_38509/g.71139 Transcript_38509/m.71139 type:complete len:223 (-) Transcript_38509:27-695(-)
MADQVSLFAPDPRRFSEYSVHPSLTEALFKRRQYNLNAANRSANSVSLHRCLEAFTRPERLDEDNAQYCSKCRGRVRAMKTMELWRLPNVLVVHLKRFEFKHTFRREKLETFVEFSDGGAGHGTVLREHFEGGREGHTQDGAQRPSWCGSLLRPGRMWRQQRPAAGHGRVRARRHPGYLRSLRRDEPLRPDGIRPLHGVRSTMERAQHGSGNVGAVRRFIRP